MYEVPPVISIIMENETLRKNFSYGNPYFDLKKQIIGDTAYWKSKAIFENSKACLMIGIRVYMTNFANTFPSSVLRCAFYKQRGRVYSHS